MIRLSPIAVLLLACLLFRPLGAAEKPNILFLFADDQCWDTLGCIGGEVETPNLDRLAASGTRFTRAYNIGSYSGAVCVASRSMLNTGRSLWKCAEFQKAGREGRAGTPSGPGKAWSERLREAGYRTYFSGKWHVNLYEPEKIFDVVGNVRAGMPKQTPAGYHRPKGPDDREWLPWDRSRGGFWEGGTHWSEVLRDQALGFLDEASESDQPFFMYLAFNAPHDPRQSPQEFVDRYPLEQLRMPDNFLPVYPFADRIGCGKGLRDERLAPFPRTEHAVKVNRQEYYAIITHMDEQIGRILDRLEEKGLRDRTHIFFSADHGLAVGQHGLLGKQNLYEHSTGVPLIVSGPGIEAGRVLDERVYLQDLVPTTLELAGARADGLDFTSFLPLLRGGAGGREVIYGAYLKLQRSVTRGDWKLIHYPEVPVDRLYDLARDPDERQDLAGDPQHAGRLAEMKKLLAAEQKRLGDDWIPAISPEPVARR